MQKVSMKLFVLLALVGTEAQADFPDPQLFSARCTGNEKFCVAFSPNDMPIHFVADAIRSAKKSVRILSYNLDVVELMPFLLKKPNVSIEVGVDYVRSDKENPANRVFKALPNRKNIVKYRTPVLRGRTPQNHNKIIIIDDEVLLMGSANHSYSGLVGNFENTMSIRDPSVIKKFNDELDEIRELSLEACRLFEVGRKGASIVMDPLKDGCLNGTAKMDPAFDVIAKTGEVPLQVMTEEAQKAVLPLIQRINGASANSPMSLKVMKGRYASIAQKSESRASEASLAYDDAFYAKFSAFYDLILEPVRPTRISARVRSEMRPVNASKNIENLPGAELTKMIGRACRRTPLPQDPQLTDLQLCVCMTQFGLLDSHQRSTGSDLGLCLKNKSFAELQQNFLKIEKMVDGKSIAQLLSEGQDPFRYRPVQTGPVRAYFAPEDNIEPIITRELHSTYSNPDKTKKSADKLKLAFAYVGTNFITNRNFSEALNGIKEAGVRLRVFFDKGRMNDPNFSSALDLLRPIGIIRQTEKIHPHSLTVFENRLSTDYGAFHHKYAVIGTDEGIKLLNGSANWSAAAVRSNDENLVVIEDEQVATIFLAQMIQDLYISRYRQNWNAPGFQDEIKEMSARVPCLLAVLGMEKSCRTRGGENWVPVKSGAVKNHVLVSVQIQADPKQTSVWAWVERTQAGSGHKQTFPVRLFTDESMGGHWVGTLPGSRGDRLEMKLIRGGKNYDARPGNLPGPGVPAEWEYPGVGNGRYFEFAHGAAYGCVPARFAPNDPGVSGVAPDQVNWKLVWGDPGTFSSASPGCRSRNPSPNVEFF